MLKFLFGAFEFLKVGRVCLSCNKKSYFSKEAYYFFTMDRDFKSASKIGSEKYSRVQEKVFQYGTAGFRDKADELSHVMYRTGLLAALRSKAVKGSTVGVMITASHNPEEDNGAKLCDPHGDMISKEWEHFATLLINSSDESLEENLALIVNSNNINYETPSSVYLAKDTRKSSSSLLNAALDGVSVLNSDAQDLGLLTTPQLHFIVCCKNMISYGTPTPMGYYKKLSDAFERLISSSRNISKKQYSPDVHIDGANGVGALKVQELQTHVKSLNMQVFNDGSEGKLNFKCGADFVKIEQKAPEGCEFVLGQRYASLDGDADRLVYFYLDHDGFHLLDGDKISSLVAKFLKELVQRTGLELEMRVIQTAYANGSSTACIERELEIPVICVPTGVKHLHHEAKQYDIGVYFEANGHGTVVFSNKAKEQISELANQSESDRQKSAEKLLSAIDLINETVGDAISDMLLVEAILHEWDWSIRNWDSIYADLPNRQLKVKVPDRQAFTTSNAGRKCLTPAGLQDAINQEVAKYKSGRCFVRASGTEDVVRVYAEADTQENADELAQTVKSLTETFTR